MGKSPSQILSEILENPNFSRNATIGFLVIIVVVLIIFLIIAVVKKDELEKELEKCKPAQ